MAAGLARYEESSRRLSDGSTHVQCMPVGVKSRRSFTEMGQPTSVLKCSGLIQRLRTSFERRCHRHERVGPDIREGSPRAIMRASSNAPQWAQHFVFLRHERTCEPLITHEYPKRTRSERQRRYKPLSNPLKLKSCRATAAMRDASCTDNSRKTLENKPVPKSLYLGSRQAVRSRS